MKNNKPCVGLLAGKGRARRIVHRHKNKCVGLLAGKGSVLTKEVCRQLAEEGISAIVFEKQPVMDEPVAETNDVLRQLRGEPGKDLFFNGWKLLF